MVDHVYLDCAARLLRVGVQAIRSGTLDVHAINPDAHAINPDLGRAWWCYGPYIHAVDISHIGIILTLGNHLYVGAVKERE